MNSSPDSCDNLTLPQIIDRETYGMTGRYLEMTRTAIRYFDELNPGRKFGTITADDVEQFEDSLLSEGRLSERYIHTLLLSFRAFRRKIIEHGKYVYRTDPRKRATPKTLDDTLRSHYTLLYEPKILARKSESARRLHRGALDRMAVFLGREAVLSDLSDEMLDAVVQWHVDRGRAIRSGNRVAECIKAQWNFLAKKRIVEAFPTFRPWPTVERTPIAWTPQQLYILFATIRSLDGTVGAAPAALFWESLFSLLFDTAERISAAMSIEWTDIDLQSRWLTVRGETRKGSAADNCVRLHADTVELLDRLQHYNSGKLVFEWPYAFNYLYRKLDRIMKLAGLPRSRFHRFHAVRKTCASMAEGMGLDAGRILKHSRRSITLKYLDPRLIKIDQLSDRLPRPIEGNASQ